MTRSSDAAHRSVHETRISLVPALVLTLVLTLVEVPKLRLARPSPESELFALPREHSESHCLQASPHSQP